MKKSSRFIFITILTLTLSACSFFGLSNVKEAKYTTIKTDNTISIRQYQPVMLAQVSLPATSFNNMSDRGFRYLFRYISGNNKQRKKIAMTTPVINQVEKIAMTTPVIMDRTKQQYRLAFFLPQQYNRNNTPIPLNKKVKIIARPAMTMAVIRFSGTVNNSSFNKMNNRLKQWIKNKGFKAAGKSQLAIYNPPWTLPMLKRNEIQIRITRKR